VGIVLQRESSGWQNPGLPTKKKHANQPPNQTQDAVLNFAAKNEGVNSFAQGVCQARLIERFVKADAQSKKTIKELK
jgi:hypothetical protein